MTERYATCHCGQLELVCQGKPKFIGMCHCEDCQRRTGSAFSQGAWFESGNVTIKGVCKTHTRMEHEGIEMTYHFCPDCGSSIYFQSPSVEASVGVAMGCFADAQFPLPTCSFYESKRHPWVSVPENIFRYMDGVKGGSLQNN